MNPPSTVPIDWQEFQLLLEAPIPVLCFNSLQKHWITVYATNWKYDKEGFEKSGIRIAAYDYRHYFGEVVDLSSKVEGQFVTYLDNAFQTVYHTGFYHTHRVEMGYLNHCISGTIEECKQFIIDHFTALFKKDRPQDNIRFIWS